MSRHLVKQGSTVGWKENPTEEDYTLTYESSGTIGWKRGYGERKVLTKDGELVGWRNITISYPGEVMTEYTSSSGQIVNNGWGNLPPPGSIYSVLLAEGFSMVHVWDPASEAFVGWSQEYGGQGYARFGVDVHLEIEYTVGDGPYPQMLYKGDVPAGTGVNLEGFSLDNFFEINMPGKTNFTHPYDGVIEVRATKL